MIEKQGIIRAYSTGPYNKFNDKEQWVRLSQGCPNRCDFCYEPKKEIVFDPFPEIVRNDVKIMDMNLLSKSNAPNIIRALGEIRVDGRVVYYELVCGIDWRFLPQSTADTLKKARFKKIRLAWDFQYIQQMQIKSAINALLLAGYRARDLTVFMVCNWEISYEECCRKKYLCAIWGVKIADCYFDGQVSPNIKPLGWTADQIKSFRKACRLHNQMTRFRFDAEAMKRYKKTGIA